MTQYFRFQYSCSFLGPYIKFCNYNAMGLNITIHHHHKFRHESHYKQLKLVNAQKDLISCLLYGVASFHIIQVLCILL